MDEQLQSSREQLHHSLAESRESGLTASLRERYTILGEISRGAMGVIYQASDNETNELLALKFILRSQPNDGELARFQLEAEVLIRLHHPNIIEIRDFGIDNGNVYFAMEFIEGENLKDYVDDCVKVDASPPPWHELALIFQDVLEALEHCHSQNVIHRDLKPQNILIDNDSHRAILADFGLLKHADQMKEGSSGTPGLTKSGEMVGTPAFMSPEQFSPGGTYGEVGVHTDVWAFGATLYYALTGVTPYNYSTPIDIFQAIITAPPPKISQSNKEVPDWLEELCMNCLKVPADKRPSIEQLKERLNTGLAAEYKDNTFLYIILALVFVLSIIVGGSAALFLSTPPNQFKTFEADKTITNRSTIGIRGELNRGPAQVLVNNKDLLEVDESGRFAGYAKLRPGKNRIQVELVGANKPTIRSVEVTVDKEPPTLVIKNRAIVKKAESNFDQKIAYYLVDESGLFSGQLLDTHPDSIKFRGKRYDIGSSGEFKLSLPLEDLGKSEVTIIIQARDKAGNVEESSFTVLRESVHKYRLDNQVLDTMRKDSLIDAYLRSLKWTDVELQSVAPLLTFKYWQKCTPEEQDKAIAVIKKKMNLDYEYIATRSFRCFRESSRVAVFKHRKTDLILHLVPGKRYEFRWYESPGDHALFAYLKILTNGRDRLQTLHDALKIYPYNDFKSDLCKLFELDKNKFNTSRRSERKHRRNEALIEKYKLADAKKICQYFEENPEKLDLLEKTLKNQLWELKKETGSTLEPEYLPPFLIGQHEVDQKTWYRNDGKPPLNKELIGGNKNNNLPIHFLNVLEIREWLSKRPGNLRLPSEHEWRYAALAGAKTDYFWGDSVEDAKKYCWYRSNSGNTLHSKADHAKAGNAFGLIDMQGNVGEWAEPMWRRWTLAWQKKDREDILESFPMENLEEQAVILGGSVWWGLNRSIPDCPYYDSTEERWGIWGFRVAVSIH
ncbi:MAG: bifunctional serine/threonine-protein kinase/formylglycine-generating enzyme family protein [Planctomycetota bacterium]|nr:bifunctional serine/threonine-protein kinase/formylglycine-generating enzyme family protein [Planctomycetota bacterium]